MSDFHVLNVNDQKDIARVVFHFDMPAGNNAAGVANATAYKEWRELGGASLVSIIPGLADDDATEDTAIKAGSVVEHVENVQFSALATNQQKLAVIQARWTALNAILPTRAAENVRFWGFSGDVT